MLFSGCGELSYEMEYNADYGVSAFQVVQVVNAQTTDFFASGIGVTDNDKNINSVDMSQATGAILCDVNKAEVLYAKNAHVRLYPASLTKVMTALVALKYGSLDQTLTATSSVNINEAGAQLLGLKVGDTMTLSQALHIMLIHSDNDVAMMIADNVCDSVEAFVELMNEEAAAIGATATHFVNPNGLTNEDHYTSVYDLYLIFNEAIQNETFREIINMSSYSTVYYDKKGKAVNVDIHSTNQYLRGNYQAPNDVTVIGGKTGTTNAAGHCLMLLTRDTSGNPYISVILQSSSRDVLYQEMSDLLREIP